MIEQGASREHMTNAMEAPPSSMYGFEMWQGTHLQASTQSFTKHMYTQTHNLWWVSCISCFSSARKFLESSKQKTERKRGELLQGLELLDTQLDDAQRCFDQAALHVMLHFQASGIFVASSLSFGCMAIRFWKGDIGRFCRSFTKHSKRAKISCCRRRVPSWPERCVVQSKSTMCEYVFVACLWNSLHPWCIGYVVVWFRISSVRAGTHHVCMCAAAETRLWWCLCICALYARVQTYISLYLYKIRTCLLPVYVTGGAPAQIERWNQHRVLWNGTGNRARNKVCGTNLRRIELATRYTVVSVNVHDWMYVMCSHTYTCIHESW